MNYKASFIIILSILISSCKFQKDNESDYDVPNDSNVEIFKFDSFGKDSLLKYSDVYSKIEYIPLETTDETLIAEITNLEVLENGDLLVFDLTKGAVILFDKTGKYIRHIGHKGKGHNEYMFPKLMKYDKYSKQVIIFDSAKSNLMFYNLQGELVSVADIDMYISDLAVLDKNHLCVYMNYRDDLTMKQKGYNIKIINKKGLIVSEYKEYGEDMQLFHPFCRHTFTQMSDGIYFIQPYSYLVSSINIDGINKAFYMDFGKHLIPREWIPGNNMDIIQKVESSENIVEIRRLWRVKDKIVMNLLRAARSTMYFLDIKDRNNDMYASYGMINDLYGIESSQDLETIKGNKLYFSMLPSQFVNCQSWIKKFRTGDDLVEKQKKSLEENMRISNNNIDKAFYKKYMESMIVLSQKDIDLINSVHEEDNPIIQVCTLKD